MAGPPKPLSNKEIQRRALRPYSPSCTSQMDRCLANDTIMHAIAHKGINGSELDSCINGSDGGTLRTRQCDPTCPDDQRTAKSIAWSPPVSEIFPEYDIPFRLEVPVICRQGTVTLDFERCRPNNSTPVIYVLRPPNEIISLCRDGEVHTADMPELHYYDENGRHGCNRTGHIAYDGEEMEYSFPICEESWGLGPDYECLGGLAIIGIRERNGNCEVSVEFRPLRGNP